MLKLVIEKSEMSFLPEIRAYVEYFERNDFEVHVAIKGSYEPGCYDAVLLFHGFHPFWRKYPRFVIGEYHSLSTGKYNRLKDFLKKYFNVRADVNVFLNNDVRCFMRFRKRASQAYRRMGYYSEYIGGSSFDVDKKFDVVYTGSIRDRVVETILNLADMGFSVAVAGNVNPIVHGNVTSFGRVNVLEAYEVMAQAKYGLNITPDIFPFNIQDSTKVIEYCAMGLGVISNKYKWISGFEKERQARFMDVVDIKTKKDVEDFIFVRPDVTDLDWEFVMNGSGIVEAIKALKID